MFLGHILDVEKSEISNGFAFFYYISRMKEKILEIIKSIWFWNLVYIVGVTIALIVCIVKINKHECPKLTVPELKQKYVEQIKEIYEIKNNDDLDSLLFELYGFQPVR